MPKGSTPSEDAEVKNPAPKTAKTSGKVTKAAKKTTKPTTVKKPVKKTKKAAPKKPVITEKDFAEWFFKLPHTKLVQYTKEWNEENLKIKLERHEEYDGWLNYFKKLSPRQVQMLARTGLDILPTDGYAALTRWHDIISNPGRIDKIHRAGLTTGKSGKTIVELAKANDRLGVLEALRDQLAEKLQQGTGARDAGQLSAQMMEVMTQIDIQVRKQAPKQETPLGTLMANMPVGGSIKRKRPSENGKGARHTSFASRVTIDDIE